MKDHSPPIRYRPAIDGLRGISVAAVFLYHLKPSLLSGGFVGVDVFFVISGYLITYIIVEDMKADRFTLRQFYSRRIARIIPHSFLVIIAALTVSLFVYGPEDLGAVGTGSIAAALSLANVKFAMQGSYFEVFSDTQPLLHYWSLAIEEQFYLLFPAFLYLATRSTRMADRLLPILLTLLLASFVIGLGMTHVNPTWAFYLLPSRAWELLAGCALAVLVANHKCHWSAANNARLQWCGLAFVVGSFFLITEGRHFPGVVALVPVLGTVMLIGPSGSSNGLIERLLSFRWLVALGKRSYSIYLWHWPVFCLIDFALFSWGDWSRLILKVSFTAAISTLAYSVFECPMRTAINTRARTAGTLVGFAMSAVIICIYGASVRSTNYSNISTSIELVSQGGVTVNDSPSAPSVVLIGDSNAGMYGKVLSDMAVRHGFNLNILSIHSLDPFPGDRLWEESIEYVERKKPDVVIYITGWGGKAERVQATVPGAISELERHVGGVVLVAQPPMLPPHANRSEFRRSGLKAIREIQSDLDNRIKAKAVLVAEAKPRVIVVETEDMFLSANGDIRFLDESGHQNYRDRTHLSYRGAAKIQDRILEALGELLPNHSLVAKLNHTRRE